MESLREPARDVPVIGRPDVLVVGGGAAGIAAAIAAARRGASTWLIEQSSALGGLATVGLINLLLTLDDGNGTQVVAGLCQEFVDRMDAMGEARFPAQEQWNREDAAAVDEWRRWGLIWGAPESVRYSVAFDPDAFVDVSIEALIAADVRVRFHTWFAGVAMDDGSIAAVFVESKNGREAIVPAVVVDATGDGDVVARAGAPSERQSIPPHLWFRVGGADDDAPPGFWFRTTGRGRALVPWGPSPNRVDACDADDLSRALLECRASAREAFLALRQQPGFEHAWLDDYAHLLGVTESRRLVGDHVLAKEEADVRFPDAIAQTGHWTRRDVVFDIPYRCLTAPGYRNLLAVGRCISTTRYVHQATKEIPAAMATGEAAGVAALVAARDAADVHAIDIPALRTDLKASGVIC
jgi:2-polyprenyl-6-methoxyphenol hydroxylase-like FAD-dependent oxidoreductase